jgi:hypothetical protein
MRKFNEAIDEVRREEVKQFKAEKQDKDADRRNFSSHRTIELSPGF